MNLIKEQSLFLNYDWKEYFKKYSDLEKNGVNTEHKAFTHYLKKGKEEKREIYHKKTKQFVSEEVDEDLFNDYHWQHYINVNNDLHHNGIKSELDAYHHYKNYGKKENRILHLKSAIEYNNYEQIITDEKDRKLMEYEKNIGKLKIHIDNNITEEHYNKNNIFSSMKLKLTSLLESKYIVSNKFPFGSLSFPEIEENISHYQNVKKYILIFLVSHTDEPLHLSKNIILFRTSLNKSKKQKNEYVLPYVWEKINKPFFIFKKTKKPIVSFCGQMNKYREKIIQQLQKNSAIQCNFIIREKYWGGKPNDPILLDEFTNNITHSHFVVCCRGRGNYSMRFYQTLSAGRIPILINNDMELPFENEIDWTSFVVIGDNEEEVIKKVLNWYETKNIEEIQKKCKYIYDHFIDKDIYFNKVLNDIYMNKIK